MYGLLSRLLKAGAVLLALTATAAAEYPDKQIRLIIPFPPGGSNDVVGRLVALHLSDVLGQLVYVDNRGGAGGTIGTDIAAKAAPDGYTLLVISSAHTVNPWLYKPLMITPRPLSRSPCSVQAPTSLRSIRNCQFTP
jgi:tripartite-type tricarboxylate transporter receptor subunit TctC